MTQILVLTALESELKAERAPEGVSVRYCGVGKINTAIATTLALNELKPRLVVNYGTCGKISDGLIGLLEVAHVVQRDMMAMPLAPRGVTPRGASGIAIMSRWTTRATSSSPVSSGVMRPHVP